MWQTTLQCLTGQKNGNEFVFPSTGRNSSPTPVITIFISGLKSRVLKLSFLSLKIIVKSGLEFILKLTEPGLAAQQVSLKGLGQFQINSRPLFTIICKLKNDNFKTREFSPLIERVLAVLALLSSQHIPSRPLFPIAVQILHDSVYHQSVWST